MRKGPREGAAGHPAGGQVKETIQGIVSFLAGLILVGFILADCAEKKDCEKRGGVWATRIWICLKKDGVLP